MYCLPVLRYVIDKFWYALYHLWQTAEHFTYMTRHFKTGPAVFQLSLMPFHRPSLHVSCGICTRDVRVPEYQCLPVSNIDNVEFARLDFLSTNFSVIADNSRISQFVKFYLINDVLAFDKFKIIKN